MERKFRAWGNTSKYDLDADPEMVPWETVKKMSPVMVEKQWEVMQYVGLQDVEGADIYEHDIVLLHDPMETKTPHATPVWFGPCGATILHHPAHRALGHGGIRSLRHYTDYDYEPDCDLAPWCLIIGNAYETSELWDWLVEVLDK